METRQINVMGKMVEIAEGATFADVAKDFSAMVNGPIMLARQKNKLRELNQKIRTCDDVTFYGIENDEAMRVYRRGVLILMTKATVLFPSFGVQLVTAMTRFSTPVNSRLVLKVR